MTAPGFPKGSDLSDHKRKDITTDSSLGKKKVAQEQDFLLFVLSAVQPHHAHGQHNGAPPVLSRLFKTACFSLQNVFVFLFSSFSRHKSPPSRPPKQAVTCWDGLFY